MSSSSGKCAYVTLATNDRYAYGALVLGQSLRRTDTPHDLVVLITPGVTALARGLLARVFTRIVQVDPLDSGDPTHLALMSRPELGTTFTKLHCWNLLEYSKGVFLDADTLVLTNVDELFERPEISAAPDIGWPDCFNSGVFVYEPSAKTFSALLEFAINQGSFDGADQGLLNQFFSSWASSDPSHRLPFLYNMAASTTYSYLPAFLHYGTNVKIVHFLGSQIKPWDHSYKAEAEEVLLHPGVSPQEVTYTMPYLKGWWKCYHTSVEPMIKEATGGASSSAGSAGPPGITSIPIVISPRSHSSASHADEPSMSGETSYLTDPSPQDAWDYGMVDYTGRDRFDNIQKHIDRMVAKGSK